MSVNPSREEQETGHGHLGDMLYPSQSRKLRWQTRKYVQQALIPGQEESIAVKILSPNANLGQLEFEPCTGIFTPRLPVLAVIKATVVEDLGLLPIEFKTPNREVDTTWGPLKPTHYVELSVQRELYGLAGISLEKVLVVPDDFPHPRGDIFFGKPFLQKHCGGALPKKVRQHARKQGISRHIITLDNSHGTGRKKTGKRSVQSKRQRSPQQTVWENQEQENVGHRPPSNKKARTSQPPTQTQNSGWYNPNQEIIGQSPELHNNATHMQPTQSSAFAPMESQYHPLLAAQAPYRNPTMPTSYYGDESIHMAAPPTRTPPMSVSYYPPRPAPGRLEPAYTPVQPQPHTGTYIPHTGGIQPDDPRHFRDQYVHVNLQAVYSDSAAQNTPEAASPQLEDPTEQYGISDSYNSYDWNPSEFDPTGDGHGQF